MSDEEIQSKADTQGEQDGQEEVIGSEQQLDVVDEEESEHELPRKVTI